MAYSYVSSKVRAAVHPGTKQLRWASDQQREAFAYGPWPLCMSGGWGAGKTALAAYKMLFLMDIFPGYRVLVGRSVWDELKRTTMSTFFKILPAYAYVLGGKRADSDKILRLNNGSEIVWLHFDDPDVANVIKGIEINAFFLDQAEDIDEQIFDDLSGRLNRWDRAVVPQWLLDAYARAGIKWPWYYPGTDTPSPPSFAVLACNPDHLLHWIYRRFHPDSDEHWEPRFDKDGNPIGSYAEQGYKMITMPSDTNRFLDKRNIAALATRDESFQRRYRRGEWGITEGQIHTIEPQSLIDGSEALLEHFRTSCSLHRAMDHGESAPTCCLWFACDRSGNVFVYREYYQGDRLISWHRRRIYELSVVQKGPPDVLESYDFNLADPSIFFKGSQRQGIKFSVADEYEDCTTQDPKTAIFWSKADNEELGIRNRISEYLTLDPSHRHPITGELGAPRLYFVRRSPAYPHGCYRVIQQVQSQKREKIGSEGGKPQFSDDRDSTVPDHAYDPLRYFIGSRPPVVVEGKPGPGPGSWSVVHQRLHQTQKQRRLLASDAREQFRTRGFR